MASQAKQALDWAIGRSGGKRRGNWAATFLRKSGGWRRGQFKVKTTSGHAGMGEWYWGAFVGDRLFLTQSHAYPTKSKAQAEARKFAASLRKAIGMELRMMFGHEETQAQLKRAANAMVKVLKG